MKYLLAIVLPPVGLLLAGKPAQALLSVILCVTVLGWIPAAIWACCVVASSEADSRTDRLIHAIKPEACEPQEQTAPTWDPAAIYKDGKIQTESREDAFQRRLQSMADKRKQP